MNRVGRNAACSCGSGKKHKHCCLQEYEASARAQREASNAALGAEVDASHVALTGELDRYQESSRAAEDVWVLIESRKFAEAESSALQYIERLPETPGGYDLMSLLCEARGEPLAAAQWCRRVIDFMRTRPAIFTQKDEVIFWKRLERLDSSDP